MAKQFVLGTAGHIDHGKTSLIKALTGIDTDRLKEEKIGEVELLFPEKVGEKSYTITLLNSTVLFAVHGGEERTCKVRTNLQMSGRCSGYCKLVFYKNSTSGRIVLTHG